ncbi:submaxillary gland androgen-regulated protein 3A-like [Capsicum annuum]|uniref:submaxillary gland androgen-regulated protein 3A-like n=1 Tax=Capsicum annuum TaxID=4072 RepID=UPI001FB102F2|nr:submaxillary gland androgen-regulated protein 3A-like [Capsicum annuum]
MPPPPLPEDLGNNPNCPPFSQAQFSVPIESPDFALGFTPWQYYPGTSSVPLAVPQPRPVTHPAPPSALVIMAPSPPEAPTYVVRPIIVLSRSARTGGHSTEIEKFGTVHEESVGNRRL